VAALLRLITKTRSASLIIINAPARFEMVQLGER
jgi:hypothetical protein